MLLSLGVVTREGLGPAGDVRSHASDISLEPASLAVGKHQATLVRGFKRGRRCRRTRRKVVWEGHCIPSVQDISEIQTVTGFEE